jgi:sugar phosphate isomerase/epimerase
VRDLATAWEIIGLADRPNAGLLIDSWHFFRSGADTELLRTIPGDKILCVQLCDAPTQAEPDVEQEAMHRRLLPGAGDAGLAELVRILDAIGSKAPLSIEVFSDELMSLPPVEAACRMGTALRDVRDAARSVTGARGAT